MDQIKQFIRRLSVFSLAISMLVMTGCGGGGTASAAFASATTTVSISPSSDSSYTVQGTGMDGVAGIQLDITYTSSLGTPTVTQGGLVSGATLAANTSTPGQIRIAIISTRPFSGNGQIALIIFSGQSGAGSITSANGSLIDSNGKTVPVSVVFSNPIGKVPDNPATYPGTITLPTDQQQRPDSKPSIASVPPMNTGETTAAKIAEKTQPADKSSEEAKPEETPQYIIYRGILDRFRQYEGIKTLATMAALFDKRVAQTIQQEPAVLLSDGKSKATLTVGIPSGIPNSPNFAVNGGRLISFRRDKQNDKNWLVEVLPEAGSVRVTVLIIAGAEKFEYPLTVAPPIETALPLDERGWNRFVRETGTAKAPLYDLNNDGVRDYQDEFIFVANHLARKKSK